MEASMNITWAPKSDNEKSPLREGDTVYLREFGDGPFVLIQEINALALKGYRRDSRARRKNEWDVRTHLIDNGWVVRDRKGNYLDYPTASLTTEKTTTFKEVAVARVKKFCLIASCAIAATSPFWGLEVISRCF